MNKNVSEAVYEEIEDLILSGRFEVRIIRKKTAKPLVVVMSAWRKDGNVVVFVEEDKD